MAEIKRLNQASRTSSLIAHRRSSWASRPACSASQGNGQDDFDATAWMAVVEEQKLAIAQAAGVDPSKVRIRIGH